MDNLLARTRAYLRVRYQIELSEEEIRIAMGRLAVHFRLLAKWHSDDEKRDASAALPVRRGEYRDAC